MPTLNWIGKDAVVNHHKEVPFRLLKPIDKFSVGDDSDNLLVQGDNLEALKGYEAVEAGANRSLRRYILNMPSTLSSMN